MKFTFFLLDNFKNIIYHDLSKKQRRFIAKRLQIEIYKRLLLDMITGDASLFTRADEIETAWQANGQPIGSYLKGAWGPAESDEQLAADGCSWSTWDGCKE